MPLASAEGGSEDCAALLHLDDGNAPAVDNYEPVTMSGAKHAGIFRKRLEDPLDGLVSSWASCSYRTSSWSPLVSRTRATISVMFKHLDPLWQVWRPPPHDKEQIGGVGKTAPELVGRPCSCIVSSPHPAGTTEARLSGPPWVVVAAGPVAFVCVRGRTHKYIPNLESVSNRAGDR